MNKAYTDEIKNSNNIRLLIINPNSMRLSNEEKVNMLLHSCKEKQIDRIIMSKVNTKWLTSNT